LKSETLGVGLGLSTASKLTQKLGGYIKIESKSNNQTEALISVLTTHSSNLSTFEQDIK
jgi:nitrogen-specific signal transduction histidine kinase